MLGRCHDRVPRRRGVVPRLRGQRHDPRFAGLCAGRLCQRVEARDDRRARCVRGRVGAAGFFDDPEQVDILTQPVFAGQHVRGIHPLERQRGAVDVAPARRDPLVEACRVRAVALTEVAERGDVVGVHRCRGADVRFDVLAVLQAEADLLRGIHFGGLCRIPQRVPRHPLQMPVMMAVGADIDHFAAARFIHVGALDVRFFFPHFRGEQPLEDFHRRRSQFFFGLLRQPFFFFPRAFDLFFGRFADVRFFARAAKVERPRAHIVDVAVEAQQQLRFPRAAQATIVGARFKPHVVRRIRNEVRQQGRGRRGHRLVQQGREQRRQRGSERHPEHDTTSAIPPQ